MSSAASSLCSCGPKTQGGLHVGIIGAGIAGVCAAIALRRAGHTCEVFERSHFTNENGAAVSVSPNGQRILERWGFDPAKSQGVENCQLRRPRGADLEMMSPTIDFRYVPEKYGSRWFFYHRADLHKQLRDIASSSELPGRPALFNLGAQVDDIYPEAGIVSFKNGSWTHKDLIIIADGQHDQLSPKITGQEIPMQWTGQTALRCLIPMDSILADPLTKPLFEHKSPGFWSPSLPQKDIVCMTYPCRNNELLNCLVVSRSLETRPETEVVEDWNFSAPPDQVASILDGFHPVIKSLIAKCPDVKMYTQKRREPLPKLFKGKAVLIGDACHPMLLTHAQGVAASIEDAAALEILLATVPTTQSRSEPASPVLSDRLSLFQQVRLPRVAATQILTEPIPSTPQSGPASVVQEQWIRKYYTGPLPPVDSPPNSQAMCDFFFGYDVTEAATTALQESEVNDIYKLVKRYQGHTSCSVHNKNSLDLAIDERRATQSTRHSLYGEPRFVTRTSSGSSDFSARVSATDSASGSDEGFASESSATTNSLKSRTRSLRSLKRGSWRHTWYSSNPTLATTTPEMPPLPTIDLTPPPLPVRSPSRRITSVYKNDPIEVRTVELPTPVSPRMSTPSLSSPSSPASSVSPVLPSPTWSIPSSTPSTTPAIVVHTRNNSNSSGRSIRSFVNKLRKTLNTDRRPKDIAPPLAPTPTAVY